MAEGMNLGQVSAIELRMTLLKDLNAEPEWLSGDLLSSEDVYWWAGPTPTIFSIGSAAPQISHLGVLTVKTVGGIVKDVDIARQYCAELNAFTSTTRWVLLNDYSTDSSSPIFMVAMSAFVVGGIEANLPYQAIRLMVEEQIAKVTALVTSNFFPLDPGDDDAWAYAYLQPAPSGQIRSQDWSRSCFYFDNNVKPFEGLNVTPVAQAAYTALNQCKTDQLSGDYGDSGAWFGVDSFPNIIFEVPYASVDWRGVIMNGMALGLEGRDTALVEGVIEENPHLGGGFLLKMRLIEGIDPEDADFLVFDLNDAPNSSACGALHGLGSWNFRDDEMIFTLFVPSSWSTLLTEEDLQWFFTQIFWNMAREAMLARSILRTGEYYYNLPYENGLAAAENSRGMAYGEPFYFD
jgi:hypothetical protein